MFEEMFGGYMGGGEPGLVGDTFSGGSGELGNMFGGGFDPMGNFTGGGEQGQPSPQEQVAAPGAPGNPVPPPQGPSAAAAQANPAAGAAPEFTPMRTAPLPAPRPDAASVQAPSADAMMERGAVQPPAAGAPPPPDAATRQGAAGGQGAAGTAPASAPPPPGQSGPAPAPSPQQSQMRGLLSSFMGSQTPQQQQMFRHIMAGIAAGLAKGAAPGSFLGGLGAGMSGAMQSRSNAESTAATNARQAATDARAERADQRAERNQHRLDEDSRSNRALTQARTQNTQNGQGAREIPAAQRMKWADEAIRRDIQDRQKMLEQQGLLATPQHRADFERYRQEQSGAIYRRYGIDPAQLQQGQGAQQGAPPPAPDRQADKPGEAGTTPAAPAPSPQPAPAGTNQPTPGQQQAGDGSSADRPARVNSQQDFERLPPGSHFINPRDGRVLIKRGPA